MRGEQRKGGRKKESPPKREKLVAGWGKKTGVGVRKKNGRRGPEKKTGGRAQNLSSKVPGKCGGHDGRKNGRMGWKKKRGVG